jgi:glycosyltransferase involved in cell wall biosynthesis
MCTLPKEPYAGRDYKAEPDARVLLFDHTAELGGGEIALVNLVCHLDLNKVKPIVVLASDGPLVKRMRGIVETHVLPLAPEVVRHKKDKLGFATLFRVRDAWSVLFYVGRLARFIHAHNIDIVHTNSLKADIIGGAAGRLAFRPVVWHVRDRIEDDYLPRVVVRIFRLLAYLIPTYVIANSVATLRTLHLRRGARSTSIPSGIELNGRSAVVHDGTNTAALQEWNRPRSGFRVGLVGRISPWKGQDIFIQAAALVNRRFPQARFFVVGAALFDEDQYDQKVRQLPGQLGIEDKVAFTGFRNDIKHAIAGLDLLVHASTKGEPFGQVIIEGMAAGKPVVATNGGGVPEIVEDGQTGILVPMGNVEAMAEAICQILADPARAKAMGTRGRQRVVDRFTLEQTARRVEAVYAEISCELASRVCTAASL